MSVTQAIESSVPTTLPLEQRPEIPVRKVKFAITESEAPFPESMAVVHFLYILSLAFPDGEQYFVDSVRYYRDRITDPVLKEQVRNFIGQEAQHGLQHRQYNEFLSDNRLNTRWIQKAIKWLFPRATRLMPPIMRLAGTCGGEHFTSILAHQVLENYKLSETADPEHRKIWMWHAVEETEHKAVAFDVYKAVGGGYLLRVFVLAMTTLGVIPLLAGALIAFMAADGKLLSWKDWAGFFRFGFGKEQGIFIKMLPDYFAYYKPSYHPWQHDNSHLVAAWKAEFENQVMVARV